MVNADLFPVQLLRILMSWGLISFPQEDVHKATGMSIASYNAYSSTQFP